MSPPSATIIDAGVGNLGNLARALRHLGATAEVTTDAATIARSDCLLLPGVGAFRPPRETLRGELEAGIAEALERGAWLLGICVGFQLLFESSDEFGATDGLGLLPGTVRRLPDTVALPHIGWNRLTPVLGKGGTVHPLLQGLSPRGDQGGETSKGGCFVYFVHSFAPLDVPDEVRVGEATHGATFTAVAGRERVLGTQFHPEKSGRSGLRLLANYLRLAAGGVPCD